MIRLLANRWERAEADIFLDGFRRGFRSLMEDFELFMRYEEDSPLPYDSIAQAVILNWETLEGSRISKGRLDDLKKGSCPTELEQARLALALNLPESVIEQLALASLPTTKKAP